MQVLIKNSNCKTETELFKFLSKVYNVKSDLIKDLEYFMHHVSSLTLDKNFETPGYIGFEAFKFLSVNKFIK